MTKRFLVVCLSVLLLMSCSLASAVGEELPEWIEDEAEDDILRMDAGDFLGRWAEHDYQGMERWLPSEWKLVEPEPVQRLANMLNRYTLLDWRVDAVSLDHEQAGEGVISAYRRTRCRITWTIPMPSKGI